MVPAVWVPWPLSSNGLLVLLTKFQPTRSSTWAVSPSWEIAVGPAAQAGVVAAGVLLHRRQDVGGVDPAVAVDVGDLAGPLVDRVIQVVEGDEPVAVDVVRFASRVAGISAWLSQTF